jgi:hypothetical protein
MNDETLETAPSLSASQILLFSMKTLSLKVTRWVTLAMAFTLFGATVWWPDWKRLVAASAFTILVSIPLWFKKDR